jgi:hypothetical protein
MKITIPFKINEQIQFFVDKSDVECSGLGKVVTTPDGYAVTEIVLLKQENTATHTEIDAAAVGKALFELRNSQGGMYFWWHSHVDMGVFWSKTDRDTIEEIGRNGLCVAVVFNKKKEKRGAVYLKGGELSPNLYFDDVTVTIEEPAEVIAARKALNLAIKNSVESDATKELWTKEFDDKCKTKEPVTVENWNRDWYNTNYLGLPKGSTTQSNFELPNFKKTNAPLYDIEAFENALNAEELVNITNLGNSLLYGLTIKEVDDSLAEIIQIIMKSKAKKKEKRGAIMGYKEMALDQKSYLADEAARLDQLENGARYDRAN